MHRTNEASVLVVSNGRGIVPISSLTILASLQDVKAWKKYEMDMVQVQSVYRCYGMLKVEHMKANRHEHSEREPVSVGKEIVAMRGYSEMNSVEILQLHPFLIVGVKVDALLPPPGARLLASADSVFERFLDIAHPVLNG